MEIIPPITQTDHKQNATQSPSLWSVFPGAGKTFVREKGNHARSPYYFLELHPDVYINHYAATDSERFPNNYISNVKELLGVFTLRTAGTSAVFMLTPHQSVRKALAAEDLPFTLIYPDRSLKQEYLNRYRSRGSSAYFIDHMDSHWDNLIDSCENDEHASIKVKLDTGEYLKDYCNLLGMEW